MGAHDRSVREDAALEVTDERVPVRGRTVVHEVSSTDETVVFTQDRGELLLLNDLAAGIYYLIDGQRTVGDIAGMVQQEFPDAQGVHDDVVRFLAGLEAAGALHFA